MSTHKMFSHTKEILALTVPFLTVIVVVSLMTAGVIDNQSVNLVKTSKETSSAVSIVNPTLTPDDYAAKIERQPVQTSSHEVGQNQLPTPTLTMDTETTTTPTIATQTGILLPESASTQSSTLIEK